MAFFSGWRLAQEGGIGGQGSDLWGFAWYASTAQMTDRMDVVGSMSQPSRAYSTRNPSCFRRRCGQRAADSDASMNASTSFAAKQAKSTHLVTPHSLNIRLISVSASAPGKSNNRTNEASMVVGAAGSFIRVITVDSASEGEAAAVGGCFDEEDMTINEYNEKERTKIAITKRITQPRAGGEKAVNQECSFTSTVTISLGQADRRLPPNSRHQFFFAQSTITVDKLWPP